MGNCINKESSVQWGGDDWSEDYSPASSSDQLSGKPKNTNLYGRRHNYNNSNYEKIREEKTETNDSVSMKETTQVKLKITRKQLEQVLGKLPEGISVEDVLAHLIKVGGVRDHHHRSWHPDLPTITEV